MRLSLGSNLRSRLPQLSLKMRLGLLFLCLMVVTIFFSSFIIYLQNEVTVRESRIAVRKNTELSKAVQLKDALSEIHRNGTQGIILQNKIAGFSELLQELYQTADTPTSQDRTENGILNLIRTRFEDYTAVLQKSNGIEASQGQELTTRFEDVAAAIESFVSEKEADIYRAADHLHLEQQKSVRMGVMLLALILLVLTYAAYRIISSFTEPLSVLARFLDEMNVEDDLHYRLPGLRWNLPEISQVARSFEQLLYRLKGYRTLNVRRLLLEKRRADIIAASIMDGIFLLREEEILYVNPVGEKILGLPPGQSWKGLNVGQLGGELAKNPGLVGIKNAITRTIPIHLELEQDQRKLHYLLQSHLISDEIIEQVEHSFHGPVEQLLDRWQATTLILAQDVTIVRESQQAKSHFIATLSHEVKTPVTSLTMATRLLKKSVDQIPNPTHRSLIETCADDVDRLRGLIEDLLSVSRFDTLTQRLDLKQVDIVKLLKQSVQHFQPQAFERGIELETKANPVGKPILLPMDATKLSWALSNLLTNALRHTPRGGKVEALVAVQDDHVEVRIRDNGPGIEKGRQEKIFNKFNPFYDLRIARSGSIGMGLAIAREIIVAHGGRIWVTSEPGHGAEFCFILPTKRNQESTSAGKVESIFKGGQSGASIGSR